MIDRRGGLDPHRRDALRDRLLERARLSSEADRRFLTIRDNEGVWTKIFDGTRAKRLGESGSAIVEMPAGGTLPTHRHGGHEECLVLRGDVEFGALRIRTGDYHLAPPGSRHAAVRSVSGALLFLRGAPVASLSVMARSVLSAWLLPSSGTEPQTVRAEERVWEGRLPGVDVQKLRCEPSGGSVLLRLQPQVTLTTRALAGGDEFLVIEGEAFFGDVLLRRGDWHFAPPGSPGQLVSSDVGAVLFAAPGDVSGFGRTSARS